VRVTHFLLQGVRGTPPSKGKQVAEQGLRRVPNASRRQASPNTRNGRNGPNGCTKLPARSSVEHAEDRGDLLEQSMAAALARIEALVRELQAS
jgi:hypothetical protein